MLVSLPELWVNLSMQPSASLSILRLDVSGQPVAWISWQEAVCLYVRQRVAWELGETAFQIRGGSSRLSGRRSGVVINSIIAVRGSASGRRLWHQAPRLNNHELFRRDGYLCMYCGKQCTERELTRDHVIPRALGGQDQWNNVVAACRRCNLLKGGRTPEQAGLSLLAVPFVPNPAEYLALKNRRILADQMEFLKKQFHHSRLLDLC